MNKLNLYEKTLMLVAASSRSDADLARSIGVTPMWMFKFKNGHIKEPGIHKVQRLHDLLSEGGGN